MTIKLTLLSVCLLLVTSLTYAQKQDQPKSIITNNVTIKKYHSSEELENMQKGELLDLYLERIRVLTNTLPYIAFATKPSVTMSTLGIPNSKENRKALDNQHENTDTYLENTMVFQKTILPYADTSKLVRAIIFYEDLLRSLHTYDEFI